LLKIKKPVFSYLWYFRSTTHRATRRTDR